MLAALFDLRFFFVSELPAIVSVALVVVLTELGGRLSRRRPDASASRPDEAVGSLARSSRERRAGRPGGCGGLHGRHHQRSIVERVRVESCSLRQLILQVDTHPFPPDTIIVPPGTYTLNPAFGALEVDAGMRIVGAGADQTTIASPVPGNRSTQGDRVFSVQGAPGGATSPVTISGVTITGGSANPVSGRPVSTLNVK